MSEMEDPHNYRKVGFSMILVAASLTAIGILHLTIGDNVLFGDQMQRDKTAFFEECKAIFYATEECQKFLKAGNTPYEIPRLSPDGEVLEEITTQSEPVAKDMSESVAKDMSVTVTIPIGVGVPGCEEIMECYLPSSLTVETGTTVIWKNLDGAVHLATSGTPDGGPDGIFDSGMIITDGTFEHKFTDNGEFQYYCLVHPWMVGTITVE
jgi:plastocyanin